MNNHIGDANEMVGAAQEPAAWVPPSFFDNGVVAATARRKPPSETAVAMRGKYVPLYAAPVTAAPTLDAELAQDRMSELCDLERDVTDSLPAVYYMDPPDGGIVSLGEQVKRMAEDAALWRKHSSTPAAPGIDLAQFREAVEHWKRDLHDDYKGGHIHDGGEAMRKAEHLLALIDASPKGGNDEANIPAPHRECYSDDGGDSWYEHPADAELVYGLKVGDTYTLIVSHCSVERTYRVTKAPDEASDDYEVEPVQATSAEVGS